MKRTFSFLLLSAILLSLISCTPTEPLITSDNTQESTVSMEESKEASETGLTVTGVYQPMKLSDLESIPVATADMTEDQLRQICVDFMRAQLTVAWTPSKNASYTTGGDPRVLEAGTVYGGLPYISSQQGNLYRLLMFYDESNGLVDMNGLTLDFARIIGNQCSSSAHWAWSRVSNSLFYSGTQTALEKNGCLRIGSYTYSDDITSFHTSKIRTANICKENGEQVMYESYALMKPADGMVRYVTSAGHIRMVSEAAVVVRDANGKIDGNKSYLIYLDQVSSWTDRSQGNGVPIKIQGGVDVKVSFNQLYKDGYLPFTIPEFVGKSAVEPSQVTCSVSKDTTSITTLKAASVSANYPISHVSSFIYDAQGNLLAKKMSCFFGLNIYEGEMKNVISTSAKSLVNGSNTVQVYVQLSTGENVLLAEGILTE